MSHTIRHAAATLAAVAGIGIALSGCATTPAAHGTIVRPAAVHATSAPTPIPGPAPTVVGTDARSVVAADLAFWQAYANGDAQTLCAGSTGYTGGKAIAMTGDELQRCLSIYGSEPTTGTKVTVGTPIIAGDFALVPVTGTVCGVVGGSNGACTSIPDVTAQLPASDTVTAVTAASGAILAKSDAGYTGWTPDLLVKAAGSWHFILPLADATPAPAPAVPTPAPRPWTDQDWNQTCASGGCGVPGLPPVLNGGGLSLGGDD